MGGLHLLALFPEESGVTGPIAIACASTAAVAGAVLLMAPGAILDTGSVRSSWSVIRRMTLAMMFLTLLLGTLFGAIAIAVDPAVLEWQQWLITLSAAAVFAIGYAVTVRSIKRLHTVGAARAGRGAASAEVVAPAAFPQAQIIRTSKGGVIFLLVVVQYADEQGRARFAKVIVDGWVKQLEPGRAWVVFERGQAHRPRRLVLHPDSHLTDVALKKRQGGATASADR